METKISLAVKVVATVKANSILHCFSVFLTGEALSLNRLANGAIYCGKSGISGNVSRNGEASHPNYDKFNIPSDKEIAIAKNKKTIIFLKLILKKRIIRKNRQRRR